MSKRKITKDSSDSESEEPTVVDVDFEFFDPLPTIDYHALKHLLAQLFQFDAEQFHLHDLTELILSQPLLGTTVKTDGRDSDPYAVLTVINMAVHQNHPAIQALAQYVLQKTTPNPALHTALQALLTQSHVGLILSERLINMPVQVVPPMYRMLADEIKWAIEENEPYDFSHFLWISRTYRLPPDEGKDTPMIPPNSKRRKAVPSPQAHIPPDGIYSFHPEDECIMRLSSHHPYEFTAAQPREEDSFGLDTGGRVMLMEANKLPELVRLMQETYPASA